MSGTMFMGRVVLPASAVLLLVVVAWNSIRMMAVRASWAAAGRDERPAATGHAAGRVAAEGRVVDVPGRRGHGRLGGARHDRSDAGAGEGDRASRRAAGAVAGR